ncbi:MAG: hypothetical protein U0Q12_05955 [Vicinamibacterales bacterium]
MTISSWGRLTAALAAIYLVGHLALLPSSLEDIDSVNFALGSHDFDVAKHQPHPPGYPLYIALARAVRPVLALASPFASPMALDVRALAIWGAILAGLAAFPLARLFRAIDGDDRVAVAATALTLGAPLVWFDASRPMSGATGLAFTWAAQGALADALVRSGRLRTTPSSVLEFPSPGGTSGGHSGRRVTPATWLAIGALIAGVAAGVRSQTVLSTVPLFAWALAVGWRRDGARSAYVAAGAFAVGVAIWAVPLLVDAGGPSAYLASFAEQAGDDLAGVDMLATNRTLRRLALGLVHTFVLPWANPLLAAPILGLATFGALLLAKRNPRGLALLAATALPYAAFHLWFQETVTTRYAVPLVAPVAYLAARGIDALARRILPTAVALLCGASLVLTLPAQIAYVGHESPVFQAVTDVERTWGRLDPRPPVGMHFSLARALRGTEVAKQALPARPGADTSEVAAYFVEHPEATVWFLADPRRTDLRRFDPAALRDRGRYRWTFDTTAFLGGIRPSDADVVEIVRPRWVLGEGWALTPEMAGQAVRRRSGPSRGPIVAHVRSRPEGARLIVGGRNLAGPGGVQATFRLSVDGSPLDEWTVGADPGFFLKQWILAPGRLSSSRPWLDVTVESRGEPGVVETAVEQFALDDERRVLLGFDEGWHEQEYNAATGALWRWSADSAALRVYGPSEDVRVRLTADAASQLAEAPVVVLRAGAREIARSAGSRRVRFDVVVPSDTIEAAGGVLHLDSSAVFVPAEHSSSRDRRRLGLQVWHVEVEAAHR